MKNFVIPKKSASLILVRSFRNPLQNCFKFNYEILLLKRVPTGSFSNMFAFPGGLYSADKDYRSDFQSNKLEGLRNTACRETLEETGLFLLPNAHSIRNSVQELMEIRQEFKEKGLDWYSFNHLSARIQYAKKEVVRPFMRLITIPLLKARYDTQFFLHRVQNQEIFNWRNFFTGKSLDSALENWDDINFDKNEFSEMIWMDPLTAIKKYYEEGFGLAAPQYILLNIMSHFPEIEKLEEFLDKPRQSDFPMMLCLRNIEDVDKNRKGYKYVAIGNCDEKYPIDIVNKEKDEELKQELITSYRDSMNSGNRLRIFFKEMHQMFEKDYDVDISLQGNNLMSFLSSYKEINKRYNQI